MSGSRPLHRPPPNRTTHPHPLATSNNELRRSSTTYGNGTNYATSPLSATARPTDMISRKRSMPYDPRGNSPPHKRNPRPDTNGAEEPQAGRGIAQDPRRNDNPWGRREPPARKFSESNVPTRNTGVDNRSPTNASPIGHSGSGASTPVQVAPTAPPMTPGPLPQAVHKAKAPDPVRSLLTTVAYDITSRQAALATERLEEQNAGGGPITLSSVQQMQKRKIDTAKSVAEEAAKRAIVKAQAGQVAISATPANNVSLAKLNENGAEESSGSRESESHNQSEVKALQIFVKQLQAKQSSYGDEQAKKQDAMQKTIADIQTAIEQQQATIEEQKTTIEEQKTTIEQQKHFLEGFIRERLTKTKEELNKYFADQIGQPSGDFKVALNQYIDHEVQQRCENIQSSLANTVDSKVQQKVGQEVPIMKQAMKQELLTDVDEKIAATENRLHSAISETVKAQSDDPPNMQSVEHRLSQLETTSKLINGGDTTLQAQIKSIKAKITTLDTSNLKRPAVQKLLDDLKLEIMETLNAKFDGIAQSNTTTEIKLMKEKIQGVLNSLETLELRTASCESQLTTMADNFKTMDDNINELDAQQQGTEKVLESLQTGLSEYVKNFIAKTFNTFRESVDTKIAKVDSKLNNTTLETVETIVTKTIPELVQSDASRGAAIQALWIELNKAKTNADRAKTLAQDASGRLEINTNSLQSLTDRYENINTEELHQRMVNEVLSRYPSNQGMIDRIIALEQAGNSVVSRTSKLEAESMQLSTKMENLSQGLGDQIQQLGNTLNDGITKEQNERATLKKEIVNHKAEVTTVMKATMLQVAKQHRVIEDINQNLPVPLPHLDLESFTNPSGAH